MDIETSRSPVATVQFIPIFNYLNLLSDFLFAKNYLPELNQNQHIKIVNALYEYLEDYRDSVIKKEELIRNLLQGSDLYGEQGNENLEPIFVNAMFDYIISSLVFDKYGNIYGFLVECLRRAENLQFDHVMKVIKANLQNAIFNNEFGGNSTLTPFAVDRIYKDIILPLFPEPKINMSILSLDYIFAQAGSTYLRLGKINIYYYPDLENYKFIDMDEENLFDEYLALGHVIGNLLHRKEIDPLTLRVFAVPALFHYIYTNVTVTNETVTNIIFHPCHWEAAYHNFFEYVVNAFNQITNQLMEDHIYNLHLELLHFKNRAILAQLILTTECKFRNKEDEKNKILSYMKNPDNFECNSDVVLPNVNEWFMEQIQNVGELYGKYDIGITRQYFEESVKGDLIDIEIKLLVNDRVLANVFNNSQPLFYELLEFYFPNSDASDYFALVKENYTARLIKVTDNEKILQEKFGFSLDEFIRSANRTTLKLVDQGINEFFENLMNYKKGRFENYLNTSGDNPTENEWWKEFGLSLVPAYPCVLNDGVTNFCEINNFEFLNKFQEDITAYITNGKTRLLLSSFGTTIQTVFIQNLIDQAVDLSVTSQNESFTVTNTFYDRLSLEIEKPEIEALSINLASINLAITIIDKLKHWMGYQFTFLNRMLNDLKFSKLSYIKYDSCIVGEEERQLLFINTVNENTGYGYKFMIINTHSKTDIAELRTVYPSKEKMLIWSFQDSSEQGKMYIKVNNETLQFENNYFIYETNNQLREKLRKSEFSGIPILHDNNDKCGNYMYLHRTRYSPNCLRYWRLDEKIRNEDEVIRIMKNSSIFNKGHTYSEENLRNSLKKYNLPNDKTFLLHFVRHWINDDNFEESDWSKSLIIENSDLLNKLRYEIRLENNNVSIFDGERRINSIYTYRERRKIEEGTLIKNIINDYNEQRASYSVTFEDYYAIRNFATTGDTRISGDTNEAKLMKLALYKLAIRQSDDTDHEFELKLFRVECKPIGTITNELYIGRHVILRKFTLTSTNVESATRNSAPSISGFRNILYEMHYNGLYFRAKIETKDDQLESVMENKVILLPGSEFTMKKITIVNLEGTGNVLKVVLVAKSQSTEKYEWYKKIMSQIKRIEL